MIGDLTLAILNAYLEGRRPDYKVEFRLRHKDGSYRWILSEASLQAGRDGKPLRMSGCHLDITERKRSEEGAEAASRHIGNVIERVSDGFVALDRDWRYTM